MGYCDDCSPCTQDVYCNPIMGRIRLINRWLKSLNKKIRNEAVIKYRTIKR